MAITRCPYCHAIIDENVKYCNNCGTQLLFSEDEDVEEEIPGEKIIDAETEEKDYTVEEPEDEARPARDKAPEKDLEEELKEETEGLALDELVAAEAGEEEDDEGEADNVTEEVILVDEIRAADTGGKNESEEPEEKEETAELKIAEEERGEDEKGDEELDEEENEAEDEEEEEKEDEEKEPEEEGEKGETEEETKEYPVVPTKGDTPAVNMEEPPPTAQPATFDTRELEGIGKTVELGKDKVDMFLEVLAEKKAEPKPPPGEVRKPSGTLPPWASTMKGAPVFPEDAGEGEAGEEYREDAAPPAVEEEIEIFPHRRGSDSTIGLPERVSQAPLPFEAGAADEDEDEAEEKPGEERPSPAEPARPARETLRPVREPDRRVREPGEEGEELEPRPPFSFSVFFKSKAFDVLFVGLFWLVALWLAANSMNATLFDILGSMSGSMLLLYAVFVFIYFFLFKFFLGETLGDRLFRERE